MEYYPDFSITAERTYDRSIINLYKDNRVNRYYDGTIPSINDNHLSKSQHLWYYIPEIFTKKQVLLYKRTYLLKMVLEYMVDNLMVKYPQIREYVKRCALNNSDCEDMLEKLNIKKINPPSKPNTDTFKWLYYQADLFLLDYYRNKRKVALVDKDRIVLKLRQLHDKISGSYPEFLSKSELENYEIHDTLSVYSMKKYITAIIQGSYPHQVLVFCYRTMIDDWNAERVIEELSEQTLETTFNNFVNLYSLQSGIPCYIVILCFISIFVKL